MSVSAKSLRSRSLNSINNSNNNRNSSHSRGLRLPHRNPRRHRATDTPSRHP